MKREICKMFPKSVEEYVGKRVLDYLKERDLEFQKYKDFYDNNRIEPWHKFVAISFISSKDNETPIEQTAMEETAMEETAIEQEMQQFCKENNINFDDLNKRLLKWNRMKSKSFFKILGSYPDFYAAMQQARMHQKKYNNTVVVEPVGKWLQFNY